MGGGRLQAAFIIFAQSNKKEICDGDSDCSTYRSVVCVPGATVMGAFVN